jgi:hypothetical protein
MSEEKAKELTKSERFVNYAKGCALILPILGALSMGVFNLFKGEPVAQKTWETVRDKLNEQSVVIDKLTKKVLYWQGHEAGRSAGAIYEKLQLAEKKNDELMAQITSKKLSRSEKESTVQLLVNKLLEERNLRKRAEDGKVSMSKKMHVQKPIRTLAPLPKKLRDVKGRAK